MHKLKTEQRFGKKLKRVCFRPSNRVRLTDRAMNPPRKQLKSVAHHNIRNYYSDALLDRHCLIFLATVDKCQ